MCDEFKETFHAIKLFLFIFFLSSTFVRPLKMLSFQSTPSRGIVFRRPLLGVLVIPSAALLLLLEHEKATPSNDLPTSWPLLEVMVMVVRLSARS